MIVILSGSPRGRNSHTNQAAVRIAESCGQPYRLLDAAGWRLRYCTGCEQCFRTGACVQEGLDDLGEIVRALRGADAVILASPVYACDMTGQMKTLIDRLSVQLHLMPLLGIPAISLATASRSFHDQVAEQLATDLEFLGASVVDRVAVCDAAPDDEKIAQAAEALSRAMAPDAALQVSGRTRAWFQHQQRQYRALLKIRDLLPDDLLGEAVQWERQGYTAFADADEAAATRQKERARRAASGTIETGGTQE